MRRVVVVVILLTLLSYRCVSPHYAAHEKTGDPIVVSACIGETVDPEERDRFDLFRGIDNFREARFYRSGGGGYEIHIETKDQKLVVFNSGQNGFWILREYIDKYEQILGSREEFEAKWEIVDYDDLGLPITMSEIDRQRGADFNACACMGTSAAIIGISVLGAMATALSGFSIFDHEVNEENERKANIVFIAGTAAGIVIGILVGSNSTKRLSKEEALESVKEARRPYVVGYYQDEDMKSLDDDPR